MYMFICPVIIVVKKSGKKAKSGSPKSMKAASRDALVREARVKAEAEGRPFDEADFIMELIQIEKQSQHLNETSSEKSHNSSTLSDKPSMTAADEKRFHFLENGLPSVIELEALTRLRQVSTSIVTSIIFFSY